AQLYAGNHGLGVAFELARIMRYIGRGAAHIEGDDLPEARALGATRRADDTASRTRQDRVLAGKTLRIGEAAIRLHEEQPHIAELARDLVDIAAQDRREIGIDD